MVRISSIGVVMGKQNASNEDSNRITTGGAVRFFELSSKPLIVSSAYINLYTAIMACCLAMVYKPLKSAAG
jgi:hypothetical protein